MSWPIAGDIRTSVKELFPVRRDRMVVLGLVALAAIVSMTELIATQLFSVIILPDDDRNTTVTALLVVLFLVFFGGLRVINFLREKYRINVFERALVDSGVSKVSDSWRWAMAMEVTSILSTMSRIAVVVAATIVLAPLFGAAVVVAVATVGYALSFLYRRQLSTQRGFRAAQLAYRSVDNVDALEVGGLGRSAHGGRGAQLTVDGLEELVPLGRFPSHPGQDTIDRGLRCWRVGDREHRGDDESTRADNTAHFDQCGTGIGEVVEHERRRRAVDRVVNERQPTDVADRGGRSRRSLMGKHRPRGVDRDRASSRGDQPTGDRPRAGTHVQHDPAGHRGCARQQRIGQRPVHEFRAVGPRRGGVLIALPGQAQAVGGGHGSHARALATWATHQASSSASPSAFSHRKVPMIAINDRPSCRSNQPAVSTPAASSPAR